MARRHHHSQGRCNRKRGKQRHDGLLAALPQLYRQSGTYLNHTGIQQKNGKTLLFLTDKAKELKEAYDSVSNEMGNIYYRDFTDKEILQFEEYLNRIRVNLEEWSDK